MRGRDRGLQAEQPLRPLLNLNEKSRPEGRLESSLEATPRFELGVKALQASALPLGDVAILTKGPDELALC